MGTNCVHLKAFLFMFFFAMKEIIWPIFLVIKKLK